jgi:hypothetical protein
MVLVLTVAKGRHSKSLWAQTTCDQNGNSLKAVLQTICHDNRDASFEQDPEFMTNELELSFRITPDAVSLAGGMVVVRR